MKFVACTYFSTGGRIRFESESYDEVMVRAQFWYDLFVLEWGGFSVEGEEVTSICVSKPCGDQIEFVKKPEAPATKVTGDPFEQR